jgi:eukaryotic-like serine/threonine-protein kinase
MGVVWLAVDVLLHTEVAVTEVPWAPQPGSAGQKSPRERALREARAVAGLDHPNVVGVHDVADDGERLWMVIQPAPFRFPWRPLSDVVADEGPLPPVQAARVGLQVLSAIRAAHAAGIVHRDIRPGNVLAGPAGRVMLAGFGMVPAGAAPAPGALIGSPAYLAPERARGEPGTAASDLWSLGATLYAAVEGRPPFAGDTTIAVLAAVAGEYPRPARRLGPLWPLISALLRKDPRARPDAAGTQWLLQRVAARPGAAPPAGPAPPVASAGPAPGGQLMRRPFGAPSQPAATTESLAQPAEAGDGGPRAGFIPGFGPGNDQPASQAPAPGQATPAQLPHDGARPRWQLLAAAAVTIVIAVIIAATGLAPHSTTSRQRAAPPGHPAALPGHHRLAPALNAPGGRRISGAGPAPPGPSRPGSPAPGNTRFGALPGGFSWYHDPTGFSIGVPDHWQISHQGHLVYIQDPSSGRFLIIDQTTHPKPSPLADWRQQEAARISTYPGYHRIRLQAVRYAQAERAADWEFTYYLNGQLTHVLNRNILATAHHAYALYWPTPASQWNASYHYFQIFAATFRPAGAPPAAAADARGAAVRDSPGSVHTSGLRGSHRPVLQSRKVMNVPGKAAGDPAPCRLASA